MTEEKGRYLTPILLQYLFLIVGRVGEQLNNQPFRQERMKGSVFALSSVLCEQAGEPEVGLLFLTVCCHTVCVCIVPCKLYSYCPFSM